MYAKVFQQIFDSSIAEDYRVRLVFEDMLKLANQDGVVDMTHEAISRRTNVPLDLVKIGIENLESPDPKSRSKEHEGRRIVRLDEHRDWGWYIVNHAHYRGLVSEEQKREKTLQRVRKHRAKQACNAPVTLGNAGNAMQKQKQKQKEGETEFPLLIGSGGIGVSERITLEKSLDRISKRLVELKDADLGRAPEERRELKAERVRILARLDLKC